MVKFKDYKEHAFSTAYYINTADDAEQKRIVQHGFTEEVNELLTDDETDSITTSKTTQLLWGTLPDNADTQALQHEKLTEVGDILYFMTATGFYTPYSLCDIAQRGLELFKTERADVQTFEEFDEQLNGAMQPRVWDEYDPDYMAMQFFNLEPFIDTNGATLYSREDFDDPLQLHPDGLYAVERLSRTFESNMFSYIMPNGYIDSAGLLLCGLSLIAQHRLGGSLAEAAQLNIDKRNRRITQATIVNGEDAERSRPAGVVRPTLQGFSSTEYNLIYGIRA